MMYPVRICMLLLAALAVPGYAAAEVPRPAASEPPGAFMDEQSHNKDLPIQIESKSLEVRDKKKVATFYGDVVVVQGDMTLKCQTLVVFYGPDENAIAAKPAATATRTAATTQKTSTTAAPGKQDIRRIEAHGSVTVVTKDHNASGDLGIYDLKAKTVTLTGNVVISQGKNVMHGDRVVFDTVTGNARVESGSTVQDRVRALIMPNKGDNGGGSSNALSFGPGR